MWQHPYKSMHPKDIRFRARISNTRGDHMWQQANKLFHSTRILFRAHISNTRCDHFRQHSNKFFHPKDIRFRARISNTRSDLFWQHKNKSVHSKDILYRVKIEAIPSFHSQPFVHKIVPSLQNTSPKPMIWSTSSQNLQSRTHQPNARPNVLSPFDFRNSRRKRTSRRSRSVSSRRAFQKYSDDPSRVATIRILPRRRRRRLPRRARAFLASSSLVSSSLPPIPLWRPSRFFHHATKVPMRFVR